MRNDSSFNNKIYKHLYVFLCIFQFLTGKVGKTFPPFRYPLKSHSGFKNKVLHSLAPNQPVNRTFEGQKPKKTTDILVVKKEGH